MRQRVEAIEADLPAAVVALAELLRLAVPRARHAVLEGMGHLGPITHAAEVNRWIAGFLLAREPAPLPAASPGNRGAFTAART